MTRARFALWLTNKLVNQGELEPQPCEQCGRAPIQKRFPFDRRRTQAHHDDYRYPLVIRWLCGSCHRFWHLKNGPGKHRDEEHESRAA